MTADETLQHLALAIGERGELAVDVGLLGVALLLSARCQSAERTAVSSASSSNGFSKKSAAPSFIASTASGTSPCPVITITGMPIARAGAAAARCR
jgi:hypothetical protein